MQICHVLVLNSYLDPSSPPPPLSEILYPPPPTTTTTHTLGPAHTHHGIEHLDLHCGPHFCPNPLILILISYILILFTDIRPKQSTVRL